MKRHSIKIEQIEIYQSPIKLKKPFVISLGQQSYAENDIIVIRTNNGISGFGECNPFMNINGENMETGFIVAQYLAKVLIGKNPLDIENCSSLMDTIIYGNSSIKSAFDIALYDIASQNSELPLYAFLGGNNKKNMKTDYTVSLGDREKMVVEAKEIIGNGYQTVKVKLGGEGQEDVERIRCIREAIGTIVPIRIDANQGWDTEEAISTLHALSPFNIQHCEEPIPRWNFMELSKVKEQSSIPIMADESCCDHHDAKRLIDLKACDSINIKLGKSSGIFKALKIIQYAEQAGMKMQVGGFLESRLGFTASAHLALTSENIVFFDFDSPLMFVDDPVIDGIKYNSNGGISMPEEPGLGASIDESYLQQLVKAIIN